MRSPIEYARSIKSSLGCSRILGVSVGRIGSRLIGWREGRGRTWLS